MVPVLQARNVTPRELIDQFGLQWVRDNSFFQEWQDDFPDLSDLENHLLDKVREGYFNLVEFPPLLEKAVQLSALSPILLLADFFLPFLFVKLMRRDRPQYATSRIFEVRNPGNELYDVLKILKHLGSLSQ